MSVCVIHHLNKLTTLKESLVTGGIGSSPTGAVGFRGAGAMTAPRRIAGFARHERT